MVGLVRRVEKVWALRVLTEKKHSMLTPNSEMPGLNSITFTGIQCRNLAVSESQFTRNKALTHLKNSSPYLKNFSTTLPIL